MNAFFDRLMVHVPSGYDKQSHEIPALELSGTGNIAIQGDWMYVSTSTQNVTIDLHNQKISSIVNQIPSGITATVLQDGMAELLLLPYQYDSATLPVTVNIASNGLWYIVGSMARTLESRKRSLRNQVAQINLSSAIGKLLDWWGITFGIERLQGEPDVLYAQRITSLKFEPNVNNIAIENILEQLGYQASVTDTGYGSFSVTIILPKKPPNSFYYSASLLADAITMIKAAAVFMSVTLEGSLQDTIHITDTISSTLNQVAWKVGDSLTIGQFTV